MNEDTPEGVNRIDWKTKEDARLCYSISDVAQMYNISEVTLRYWEREGAFTVPRFTAGGNRYYGREQLEVIDQLNFLIYGQGFTLKGAMERIGHPVTLERVEIHDRLRRIRDELSHTSELLDHFSKE